MPSKSKAICGEVIVNTCVFSVNDKYSSRLWL